MLRLLYIYDALCGWCYGSSPVIGKLHDAYKERLAFDVRSGIMVPPEHAQPIAAKAAYIAQAYKTVEEYTGVTFGEAYLQHIFHPESSPWVEESLTPATALCLLKAGDSRQAFHFASAIQNAHMAEGKDLSDAETYRPLAESIGLEWEDFRTKLASEEWRETAQYEAALVRQLGVTGFPAVVVQVSEDKFYLIARGYTPYEDLSARLAHVLREATAA